MGNVETSEETWGNEVLTGELLGKSETADHETESFSLSHIREINVYKTVKEINVSKSSGIEGISSFIIKEAFQILIQEVNS